MEAFHPEHRVTTPIGRFVFGVASMLLGVASLVLRDQLVSNWHWPGDAVFLDTTSAGLIAAGIAITVPRTERIGAGILSAVYLLFALTFVPDIFSQPGAYDSWGNVFYELAPASGAFVSFGLASPPRRSVNAACTASVIVLGLSNVSFAIEQVEFLARTASLVPGWMPLGGTFWAIATTVAFGLAGMSIASGYRSQLASRLTAAMLAMFGILIWIPMLVADPKSHANWSEGLETFVIAGATWIVSEWLGRERSASPASTARSRPVPRAP